MDSRTSPILELRNIGFHIQKDAPILQNISLSIAQGESLAIVGKNGSGKSTLGRIMAGLLQPKVGDCVIQENHSSSGEFLSATVGMVFQNPDNQLVGSVVDEDLRYGLENYGIPQDIQDQRIAEVLDSLDITSLRSRFIETLSGGQKQIVALAGMLVLQPKILILDEVASMVDPWMKERMIQIIERLKKDFTLITISHDPLLVSHAERVIVLDRGSIVGDMTPLELYYERAEDFDITPPPIVTLTKSWKKRGYSVPEGFSAEKLAEAVCQLL